MHPDPSRSASTKLPFVAYGGRPTAFTGERPLLPTRQRRALNGQSKHPAPLPEIAINMFWHAKYHKDPANEWLRGMVFRLHADQSSSGVSSVPST